VPGFWLRDEEASMYLAMAYGLGVCTSLMVLALLWLGWENRRDEALAARAEKAARKIPS
jgi:hypothetical protein